MDVTFWGVRGSIPTPGSHTARWGGNTSCLEVRHNNLPPLVLDCGTGARGLGNKLVRERAREVHLLFSHLHVDHVFGFPFFMPIYGPGWKVNVRLPAYSAEEARERISRYLNGTFHPTRLRDVPCELCFEAVRPGREFDAGGFHVTPVRLTHPGGAIGYRIDVDGSSFAYLSDTSPFARPGEGAVAGEELSGPERRVMTVLTGVDTVVYDTMYSYDEYLEKMTWGHSYPEYAIALCKAAGVRRLVLFHHLPDATDDELDARALHYREVEGIEVILAREGETLRVGTAAEVTAIV